MESTREHIPQLDGLRGIAVMAVLWSHVYGPRWLLPRPSASFGQFGVSLFFCLSGFLITRILLWNRESGIGLGLFWLRRAARILPPFIAFLAEVAWFWPDWTIWLAVGYVQNWFVPFVDIPRVTGHCWSLSIEEQFYLVWPVVCLLPRRAVGFVSASLVAASVALWLALPVWLDGLGWDVREIHLAVIFWTPTRLGCLAVGSLVAVNERWCLARRVRLAWAGAGLVLVSALLWPALEPRVYRLELWALLAKVGAAQVAACGVFLVALLGTWRPVESLLVDRLLCRVGRVSYGVYLYHVPIFVVLGLFSGRAILGPMTWVVGWAMSFAVASVSYRLLERPVMAWAARASSGRVATLGRPVAQSPGVAS